MQYVYPAVIKTEDGGYDVSFPDIEGAITCADDLASAIENAQDVLSMMLVQLEDEGKELPKPSQQAAIAQENAVVTLVLADTLAYRKKINKRAVKKTLSIPQWMNEEAEKRGINFSQVLQEALMERLV